MTVETSVTPETGQAPRPWGILMTVVWTVAAVIALGIASVAAVLIWFPDAVMQETDFSKDAHAFGILFIVSVIAEVAVLAVAARLARWRVADYLGLVMPERREALIAVAV